MQHIPGEKRPDYVRRNEAARNDAGRDDTNVFTDSYCTAPHYNPNDPDQRQWATPFWPVDLAMHEETYNHRGRPWFQRYTGEHIPVSHLTDLSTSLVQLYRFNGSNSDKRLGRQCAQH